MRSASAARVGVSNAGRQPTAWPARARPASQSAVLPGEACRARRRGSRESYIDQRRSCGQRQNTPDPGGAGGHETLMWAWFSMKFHEPSGNVRSFAADEPQRPACRAGECESCRPHSSREHSSELFNPGTDVDLQRHSACGLRGSRAASHRASIHAERLLLALTTSAGVRCRRDALRWFLWKGGPHDSAP